MLLLQSHHPKDSPASLATFPAHLTATNGHSGVQVPFYPFKEAAPSLPNLAQVWLQVLHLLSSHMNKQTNQRQSMEANSKQWSQKV